MCESFYQCISFSNISNSNIVLPVLAFLSVILLLLQKIFFKVRTKFPITVNCWFCNSNTSVPYNSSNSWFCPKCDQYNGFTADGSYNRVVTEQFNGKLNCDSWTIKTKQKRIASNGLCRFCNVNLELKVQQLAQFVPLNKANYEEEVQQYSDRLERVYRLCSKCQSVLEKTLCEKQDLYILKQQASFKATPAQLTPKSSPVHAICLHLTTLLSVALLVSAVPRGWIEHVAESASLPDYINDALLVAQSHMPQPALSLALLCSAGIITQICDWLVMRNTSSFVKLLLWVILPSLIYVPDHFDKTISVIKALSSIVLFTTSFTERRLHKRKYNISPLSNPQQFQKLEKRSEITSPRKRELMGEDRPKSAAFSSKSTVTEPIPARPSPTPLHESTPEDFGLGKLNVSARIVTRSQVKPFQTKNYGSQVQSNLFKPKPVNLSPPKLHFDHSDYQIPITRSSSQSSGFVSLSHQKDFDEYRSASITGDDSVSQCGAGGVMSRYQSNGVPSMSLSPYGMPFSHFQPYAILHYSHSHYNKMFPYHNIPSIEVPFNMSTSTKEEGWWHKVKSGLYSFCIFILFVTNLTILWKEFGQEFLKMLT